MNHTHTTGPRVLALDFSTNTGWAVHASGVITHGTQVFARYTGCKSKPADHVGKRYLDFMRWLKERIRDDKPDLIVYEKPMGHMKSAAARDIISGFQGVMLMVSAAYNLPTKSYTQTEVKTWATGKGNAKKEAMVARAVKLSGGDSFVTDDAADAFLVLSLHLSTLKP